MSDMVRGQLTKIERNKLVSLITMEIHNRLVLCFLHDLYLLTNNTPLHVFALLRCLTAAKCCIQQAWSHKYVLISLQGRDGAYD